MGQSILLIAVDAAHADTASRVLDERQAGSGASSADTVIVLPVGDAPVVLDTAELEKSNHGSALRSNGVHLLPQGRLFLVEDGVLCLRPREAAHESSPLMHLAASIARQYGSGLTVMMLTTQADEGVEALIEQAGGTLLEAGGPATGHGQPLHDHRLLPASTPSAGPGTARAGHMAHDLRQPLQTLTLLQNLLARQVTEPKSRNLVERLGETIQQLVEMLSQPGGLVPPPVPQMEVEAPAKASGSREVAASGDTRQPVYVIDDDRSIREAIRSVLEEDGLLVQDFDRCEAFLAGFDRESQGCLLVDAYLPGMSGLDLLEHLKSEGISLPAIMITGSSDVQMAVRAMKMGATDFIEKPVGANALLAGVHQALELARDSEVENVNREKAAQALKGLTRRQRQIMAMVLDGQPSKNIAADLCISQRTVENHRAAIMKKTGSRSLPALARLVLSLPAREIE